MKQLQYRIQPYIGQVTDHRHEWKMHDEKTIVTADMRQTMRDAARDCLYQMRIVDSKKEPTKALVWDAAAKEYKQPQS